MNKRLLYEVHPTKGDEVSREGNEMKTAVFSVILILVSVLLFGIAFFALLSFVTRSVSDTRWPRMGQDISHILTCDKNSSNPLIHIKKENLYVKSLAPIGIQSIIFIFTISWHFFLQIDNSRLISFTPKQWNAAYLFQFREGEGVAVFGSELHEPHVGRVRELRDDAETGKQPARWDSVGFTPMMPCGAA